MQNNLFSFVAKYKLSEPYTKNIFIAKGDRVVVEKMDAEHVTFDFENKTHNHTGESITVDRKVFEAHFEK